MGISQLDSRRGTVEVSCYWMTKKTERLWKLPSEIFKDSMYIPLFLFYLVIFPLHI